MAADPYLAVTLDVKRRIAQVARALEQPHPGPAAWGLWELLEDVWRRKDPDVTALLLAACFGPDPRWPTALVEFGFLVAKGAGWELCAEEADRLLRTHRQRVEAGKSRAATAGRAVDGRWSPAGPSAGPPLVSPTSTPPAGDQRPTSGGPALTASSQQPAASSQQQGRGASPAPIVGGGGIWRSGHPHVPHPATALGQEDADPPGRPALLDQLEAAHQELRHRPLEWGPSRNRVAIERSLGDLAAQHGEAEVVRRLRNACTVPKGKFPYFAQVSDLLDAKHWSQYAEPHASAPPGRADAGAATAAQKDWSQPLKTPTRWDEELEMEVYTRE